MDPDIGKVYTAMLKEKTGAKVLTFKISCKQGTLEWNKNLTGTMVFDNTSEGLDIAFSPFRAHLDGYEVKVREKTYRTMFFDGDEVAQVFDCEGIKVTEILGNRARI